jgi:hypothetical protein
MHLFCNSRFGVKYISKLLLKSNSSSDLYFSFCRIIPPLINPRTLGCSLNEKGQ